MKQEFCNLSVGLQRFYKTMCSSEVHFCNLLQLFGFVVQVVIGLVAKGFCGVYTCIRLLYAWSSWGVEDIQVLLELSLVMNCSHNLVFV